MTTSNLIHDLDAAGKRLGDPALQDLLCDQAYRHNGWFTPDNTKKALDSLLPWLEAEALERWISNYPSPSGPPRTVGVVAAGNIPMAGFHDALSVLVCGHRLNIKLSSQDDQLIPLIFSELLKINSAWSSRISIVDQIRGCDAVIATGSNNTARYFEYYFRHIPLLLRRNRNSAALLTGNESDKELQGLADDMLQYFGLGCRSVSHLMVPAQFDLNRVIGQMRHWHHLADHHKFANSHTYQRAILMLDQQPFIENGFLIFRESDQLASPVATIHYSRYASMDEAMDRLSSWRTDLQCLVTGTSEYPSGIPFGAAQRPGLADYADGIDTIDFLTRL